MCKKKHGNIDELKPYSRKVAQYRKKVLIADLIKGRQ